MTPKTADQLIKLGYDLVIKSGAGAAAKFADAAYEAAGVTVAPADEVWTSDVVLKVNEPSAVEVARLSEGAVILARMGLGDQPELFQALNARKATGLPWAPFGGSPGRSRWIRSPRCRTSPATAG